MRDPMITAVPRSPAPTGVQIIAVSGADVGRVFRIERVAILGRSGDSDVVLGDDDVSREHARIVRRDLGYYVEDLRSTNGTFVNGERVSSRRLELGDKVRIGIHSVFQVAPFDSIEDELRERQRLETVGRLGGSIAHDFKNMLGAIRASVDGIQRMSPEERAGADIENWLTDMLTATERAGELATHLLEASRKGPGTSRPFDISQLCDEVAQLAERAFSDQGTVLTNIEKGLRVRGNRSALYQVLTNLWVNARDAMSAGDEVTISCERRQAKEGERVIIKVSDTGVGIDLLSLARIFEPFYTTKPKGVGFGLGLAMVKETIERHGGAVHVASELGQGTVVTLVLPIDVPVARREAETFSDDEPAPGGRVLIVDNEAVLRRVYRRLLAREGYDVVEEEDAGAALGRLSSGEHDLVVLDVDMPAMGGLKMLEALRAGNVTTPVILVTGSDTERVHACARELGVQEVLIKPVSAGALLLSVSNALLRPSSPQVRNTPRLGPHMVDALRQQLADEDDA